MEENKGLGTDRKKTKKKQNDVSYGCFGECGAV